MVPLSPALCVITGAPHSGKTSVLERLAAAGHEVVPEAALVVVNELRREVPDLAAWRAANGEAFQERIVARQVALEARARQTNAPVVFLDRALPDGLAFSRHFGHRPPASLLASVADASYDQVFLLELVLPFDGRRATGRVSNQSAAESLHKAVFETWTALGLPPTIVPFASIEERTQFVLDRVSAL